MTEEPKKGIRWGFVLVATLSGVLLGVLFSLLFDFIGQPWQAALVLGGIGLVVGVVQPWLNAKARGAMRHP
ncbi:hypothetical protein AB0933_17415 [Streptomyces venezuelae]|uniref:hypothetical protein n=1 Tax=Streptomyces venezuelae TaxID=54571 RepID=UPI00345156AA